MNAIINNAIANGLDWDIFETAIGNTCVQVFYNNYYYVEYEFCGDMLVDCVEYQIHRKYIIFSEKKRLTTARKYAIIKAQKRKRKR